MHHTQCPVTGIHGIDDDSKRIDVINLFKRHGLVTNFAIQTVKMLFATQYTRGTAFSCTTRRSDSRIDFIENFLAITARPFTAFSSTW